MEKIITIHIEKLPEGVYLATSDDLQGLVAQGRTVTEALEIARDVARKLIEARTERSSDMPEGLVGKTLAIWFKHRELDFCEAQPPKKCLSRQWSNVVRAGKNP